MSDIRTDLRTLATQELNACFGHLPTTALVELVAADFARDEVGRLIVSALPAWTDADVWSYAHEHRLTYNVLYQQGYPSIGCNPCTRAVAPGDDPRSGRWWWEDTDHKECGLHLRRDPEVHRVN